jgi:hypothetical protein
VVVKAIKALKTFISTIYDKNFEKFLHFSKFQNKIIPKSLKNLTKTKSYIYKNLKWASRLKSK